MGISWECDDRKQTASGTPQMPMDSITHNHVEYNMTKGSGNTFVSPQHDVVAYLQSQHIIEIILQVGTGIQGINVCMRIEAGMPG